MSTGHHSRQLDGAKTNILTFQVPSYVNALQLSHVWARHVRPWTWMMIFFFIGANLLIIQPFEMNQPQTCEEYIVMFEE